MALPTLEMGKTVGRESFGRRIRSSVWDILNLRSLLNFQKMCPVNSESMKGKVYSSIFKGTNERLKMGEEKTAIFKHLVCTRNLGRAFPK